MAEPARIPDLRDLRPLLREAFPVEPVPRRRSTTAKALDVFPYLSSWRDVSREALYAEPHCFVSLDPASRRYYLPALLDAAIEGSAEFVAGVVDTLGPEPWHVYWGDPSEGFDRHAFTLPQQHVIERFLCAMMFDGVPQPLLEREPVAHLQQKASLALLHAWNRPGRGLHLARRYDVALSAWNRVDPPLRSAAAAVVAEIDRVFERSSPPVRLLEGRCNGGDGEEYACLLAGREWWTLHPYLAARTPTAPCFLSPEAYVYYLPAYMLSQLVDPSQGYYTNFDTYFDQDDEARPQLLNDEQWQVVQDFSRRCHEQGW